MAKLVQATSEDGEVYVNLDNVTHIVRGPDPDDLTTVYFVGGETVEVKELPKHFFDRST